MKIRANLHVKERKNFEKNLRKRERKNWEGKVVRRVVRRLASVASYPYDLIFSYVGAQNQILDRETSKKYLLV